MEKPVKKLDHTSHLILHRTSRKEVREGITVIVKGEGIWVYDQDGKRYLDLDAGVTRPVHIGHGSKELAQAAYDQMCRLAYFTPMSFANVPAMELAEVLAGIAPAGINRFTFVCGGSEAVETAMKLAKHYHHYRGDRAGSRSCPGGGPTTGSPAGALACSGTVMPMRQMMEPLAARHHLRRIPLLLPLPPPSHLPRNCDMPAPGTWSGIIEFEGRTQFSAFIGEPIQQAYGALKPPAEYWPIIREICDRYGILLIIDEVICGFGRTGKMFGTEHFDIQPDMITMAKGITSGYVPLGAVGCTDKVVEPIEVFNHLHTYGNHPVPCAGGREKHRDPQAGQPGGKQRGHGGLFPGRAEEPSGPSIRRRSPRHRPLAGGRFRHRQKKAHPLPHRQPDEPAGAGQAKRGHHQDHGPGPGVRATADHPEGGDRFRSQGDRRVHHRRRKGPWSLSMEEATILEDVFLFPPD